MQLQMKGFCLEYSWEKGGLDGRRWVMVVYGIGVSHVMESVILVTFFYLLKCMFEVLAPS